MSVAELPWDLLVARAMGEAETGGGPDPGIGTALEALAHAHEQAVDRARRRRDGVWYTPAPLADLVAERAGPAGPVVVDPACGCGALLVAVARRERAAGRDPTALVWVARDLDADAVRIARARVAFALDPTAPAAMDARLTSTFTVGDGLDLPTEGLDATVVMNPPFGGAVRARTGRDRATTEHLRARWPLAARGAFDRCAPFVAWAARRTREGGRAALVLPRTWLAAPAGAALRAHIDATAGLASLDEVRDAFSDAAVPVVVTALPGGAGTVEVTDATGRRAHRRAPIDGLWGPLVSPHAATLDALDGAPALGTVCTIAASATTGEAYAIRDAVYDAACGATEPAQAPQRPPADAAAGDAFRLVTSGAIHPLAHHWGVDPQRYLGRDLQRPMVPRAAAPPRRRTAWDRPRVLVPGLAALLEAVVVAPGVAGAVATLAINVDRAGPPLHRLAAVLNGTLARVAYRALWAAQAMAGGSTPITRGRLEALPVPRALLAPGSADACGTTTAALREAAAECAGDPLQLPPVAMLREIAARAAALGPADALVPALDEVLATSPAPIAVAAVDLVSAAIAPIAWATLLDDPAAGASGP